MLCAFVGLSFERFVWVGGPKGKRGKDQARSIQAGLEMVLLFG